MEDIKGRVLFKINCNCNTQLSTLPGDEQLSFWRAFHCVWCVEEEGPPVSVPLQGVRKGILVDVTT